VKRYRTEGALEEACRNAAKKRGWDSRKMNGLGYRSWPDRQFIPPEVRSGEKVGVKRRAQRSWWVEFKQPGEEPTPSQAQKIKELRARGEDVSVIDTREDFIRELEKR
jgi:hypothetical protein